MRFICSTCGQEHSIDDVSFGSDAPLQWGLLTDEERAQSMLSGEECEIEKGTALSYYIRACLEIPPHGRGVTGHAITGVRDEVAADAASGHHQPVHILRDERPQRNVIRLDLQAFVLNSVRRCAALANGAAQLAIMSRG